MKSFGFLNRCGDRCETPVRRLQDSDSLPGCGASWFCPRGSRKSDRVSSWPDGSAESSAGLTISLVEDGEAAADTAATGVTGMWQIFPV